MEKESKKIVLRSYKMTHASGFAPNFNGGILTLATCKPYIREKAVIGEWIAGFTSKRLCNDEVGKERLVYLMKVTDKITFDEYWESGKYDFKKPNKVAPYENGDNIYKPVKGKECKYEQIPNEDHKKEDIDRDTKSNKVLISNEFYYFGGSSPLHIDEFKNKIRIPKASSSYGWLTEGDIVNEFINFVSKQNPKPDISCNVKKNVGKQNSCSKGK